MGITVVILTALNIEYEAVHRWLHGIRRMDHPAGTIFEVGRLDESEAEVALAVTGPGNIAAAVVAERAIAMLKPQALMYVGVAGALHEDLELGDVVIATKVYAHHGGRVESHGFLPRPRSWDGPHQLEQIARYVVRTAAHRPRLDAEADPAIHFRPIASGEIVVNSREHPTARQLRQTYGDAAAVEMEGAGATQAGQLNGVPVLTVRGISDRADGSKPATDRRGWPIVAAGNAAAVALAIAAQLPEPPWPPDNGPTQAETAPRQIPASGGPFVGRERHLARLDEVLLDPAGGRPRLAVLTGMAGAGKTALALRWAHHAADHFPDGLLYADGRGFGPDPPLRAHEIAAGFIRALGQVPWAESGSVDQRATQLRSALDGRRVLLVLDNANSVDQVRPLLPGDRSAALLVTSRERLRGLAVHHDAELLRVEPLEADHAERLLREAIGARATADPAATTRLAARCAGLPLALRIAAERVTSLPAENFTTLVDEIVGPEAMDQLDTGDDPHSAVRTVFSWSYRGLDESAAEVFRRLSLHPGAAFGLAAAAALTGRSEASAAVLLRVLVNAHLVAEPAARRFEMHSLVREFALSLCAEIDDIAVRDRAVRRLIDQYLHTADRAGRMIMPYRYRPRLESTPTVAVHFGDRPSALRWFDTEHDNLIEVCRLPDPALDTPRWLLAYSLRDYFYLTKDFDGWLDTHRAAAEGARRLDDPRAEGMTRNNLGRALQETGDNEGSIAQYRLAHDLLTRAGDAHGTTDALANLASALRHQGAYQEVLGYQRAVLAVYRETGLRRKVGITLRSIARTQLELGDLDAAAEHAEAALTEFAEMGLDLDAAQTLRTLTQIHRRLGRRARAEETGAEAIRHCRRAGSDYEEAMTWHVLGAVAADTGHVEQAVRRWNDALAILRRLGSPQARVVEADLANLRPPPGQL